MNSLLRALLLAALAAVSAQAQPALAGFSTSVSLDEEGAWVYLFVDGSAGPRSVLISAAGPGYATQTSARVVSDPQIEVLDPSGNRIAYNDDRADSVLSDPSLPTYARTTKDSALRLSLATGAYVVRVSGVLGATGVVGIDVIDSSPRPGLASWALRARGGDASSTTVRLRTFGNGSMNTGLFLSGPNLPVTNPMDDPRLTYSSVSVIGNGDGTVTPTTNPFTQTWDSLLVPSSTPARVRSPVSGDGRNAGFAALYSVAPGMPTSLIVQSQTAQTNGMFLLEVHNLDNPLLRPPVVYAPPRSLTVAAGANAMLNAIVGGDSSTSVILEKDGATFSPFTSGLFLILGAGPSQAGTYRVRATNTSGTALSVPAVVTVTPSAPFISASPVSTTVNVGETLTLTATVTGTGLSYQWLKNGTPLPGATAASLTLTDIKESDAGAYALRVTNGGGSVTSVPGNLTVQAADPGRLTNLAVRAFTGLGDRVLIVGFTLSGPGAKPIIIRGIGPGLAALGIPGTITDPRLGLFLGDQEIVSNDNWLGEDGRALGAFALTPGSRDAVIATSLAAQTLTAQVSGIGGTVGEAMVEVYDALPANSTLRLVNVSTRTQLDDGQRLIVGLTVSGRQAARLLIRAVGPTLATLGVTTAHPDPSLELYSGSTIIQQNDQWQGDDGRQSGAFPLVAGSRDAALITSLVPGGYSVHVLGARNTSGIVLVEVYELR